MYLSPCRGGLGLRMCGEKRPDEEHRFYFTLFVVFFCVCVGGEVVVQRMNSGPLNARKVSSPSHTLFFLGSVLVENVELGDVLDTEGQPNTSFLTWQMLAATKGRNKAAPCPLEPPMGLGTAAAAITLCVHRGNRQADQGPSRAPSNLVS